VTDLTVVAVHTHIHTPGARVRQLDPLGPLRQPPNPHLVVLDLSVLCRFGRGQPPLPTDAEPRKGPARDCISGHIQGHVVHTVGQEPVADLLRGLPRLVCVEVDPPLHNPPAPVDLQGHVGLVSTDQGWDTHAALVVPAHPVGAGHVQVIAQGIGMRLTVGIGVRPVVGVSEPGTRQDMVRPLVDGQCRVPRRGGQIRGIPPVMLLPAWGQRGDQEVVLCLTVLVAAAGA